MTNDQFREDMKRRLIHHQLCMILSTRRAWSRANCLNWPLEADVDHLVAGMLYQPTPIERARYWLRSLRRRMPRLVWPGQRVWVNVLFTEAKLPGIQVSSLEELMNRSVEAMSSGHMAQVERALAEIGIEFDAGMSADGRDWQWDWSLRGPIEVTFCGVAPKRKLP